MLYIDRQVRRGDYRVFVILSVRFAIETSVHLYDVTVARQRSTCLALSQWCWSHSFWCSCCIRFRKRLLQFTSSISITPLYISMQVRVAPYYWLVIAAVWRLGYERQAKLKLFIHTTGAVSHGSHHRLWSISSRMSQVRYGLRIEILCASRQCQAYRRPRVDKKWPLKQRACIQQAARAQHVHCTRRPRKPFIALLRRAFEYEKRAFNHDSCTHLSVSYLFFAQRRHLLYLTLKSRWIFLRAAPN